MIVKEKFELEYLLNTSPKVLENMLFTPSGLSEWFADDVNIHGDIYSFFWDGNEEKAQLLTKRPSNKIKWQWLNDQDEGIDSFFEIRFEIDPMTNAVILKITDFAEEDELDDVRALWENSIHELKRVLGA